MNFKLVFLGWVSVACITNAKSFVDITARTGLPQVDSTTINFGDFDDDGRVDMMAAQKLFRNVTRGNQIQFEDVTAKVGLAHAKGYGVFVDINNDGRLDIVTTAGQIFMQTKDENFTDLAAYFEASLPSAIFSISLVDYDQDGWVDLFFGIEETHSADLSVFNHFPVRVFKNNHGTSFIDVSADFDLANNPSYTRSMVWADYDQSGTPDGFFANYRLKPSFFLKNNGGVLKDIALENKTAGPFEPEKFYDNHYKKRFGPKWGHAIGAMWADLNNDGLFDLWVNKLSHKFAGMGSNGGYDHRGYLCDDSKIFKNLGFPDFQFVDQREHSKIPIKPITGDLNKTEDELWGHVTSADYDNDGLLDVYVTQVYNMDYSYSYLFKNQGKFQFEDQALVENLRTFDAYGASWADLNNDGKMDLVIGGRVGNAAPAFMRVFQNVSVNQNHFLQVRLKGTRSGASPVTAKVSVYAEGQFFLRQFEGVVGTYNQQNDPTLHFGLGSVKKIDRVEVQWPSGRKQIIQDVKVDRLLKIQEPE